ncbi:hypothetical protein BJY01DRAFT_248064 [Aspergillus pseudoustus]|uniref:Nephrocystin 3-like N-terminal domain-containing protein n=1 Tax=Aspergillus pseudoustus TaxID=1810923 RepID=A0ABR4JWX4_9EURO
MASSRLSHVDYTVAWISALPHEMTAGRAMLDQIHPDLPPRSGDTNSYTLGSVHGHNVVMVCLPAMGTNSAVAVVNHLRSSFPNVQYGLMVGIGGGVPSAKADIRLGDIAVSKPVDKYPGVVQYDFGKSIAGGRFEQTGTLNRPPEILLSVLSSLEARYLDLDSPISTIVSERLALNVKMTSFRCPGPDRDQLFESSYEHPEFEDNCSECDIDRLVKRENRSTTEPIVWYGLIASGNQVMKDGLVRDTLSTKSPILCFEMEAAGIMNYLPCLVIRGICDYCDSHKKKKWQAYAAMTAAAYARLLLSIVPRAMEGSQVVTSGPSMTPEEIECCRALFVTDPEEDMSRLKRRKGGHAPGTCTWILDTEQLNLWLGHSSSPEERPTIFWLHGNPGVGKSTITIAMTEMLRSHPSFISGQKTLAYFFCESSSDKHISATSILRGLLYQLIQQHPEWVSFLMPKYSIQKDRFFASFDALWSVLLAIAKQNGEIYCIIDALDECTQDSQETLLAQLGQTFDTTSGGSGDLGIHLMITSRPYDEIGRQLQQFYHHDLSAFPSLKHDVDLLIERKVDELSKRNAYPESVKQEVARILKEKADGTSLWVGIACRELRDVRSRNAAKTLQTLPRTLDSLYNTLLKAAKEHNPDDFDAVARILGVVAIAIRPLTILELSELSQLYLEHDEKLRYAFTRDNIHMCRLLVVVQDGTVSLLHKSLRDFLLRGDQKVVDERAAHAQAAYRCLDQIIDSFKDFDIYDYTRHNNSFVFYSSKYWPQHAFLAFDEFQVLQSHAVLFEPQSQVRDAWLEFIRYHNVFKVPPLTQPTLIQLVSEWGSLPIANYVLADPRHAGGLQNLLECSAYEGSIQLFSFLVTQQSAIITPEVIMAALRNRKTGREITKIIFERRKVEFPISEWAAVDAAVYGHLELFKWYLQDPADGFSLSRRFVEGISRHPSGGIKIMSLVLPHIAKRPDLIEQHLKITARHGNRKLMELVLDHLKANYAITEDVVQQAIYNFHYGPDIFRLLWDRLGNCLPVSEDTELFSFVHYNEEFVEITFDLLQDGIPSMRHIWDRPVKHRVHFLLTLLRKRASILITRDMLDTAVEANSEELMIALLERSETLDMIDEELIRAAACHGSTATVRLLYDCVSRAVTITEEIAMAAASNEPHGRWVVDFFLQLPGCDFPITQAVVDTASANGISGLYIISQLENHANKPLISRESLLELSAKHGWLGPLAEYYPQPGEDSQGRDELDIIIFQYRALDELSNFYEPRLESLQTISKDTILAAIGDSLYFTAEMIKLLTGRGVKIPVDEDVIMTAGKDGNYSSEASMLLFEMVRNYGDANPEIIKLAAFYAAADERTIALIIKTYPELLLNEDLMWRIATMGNARPLQILLHEKGANSPISSESLKVLARNGRSVLASRTGPLQKLLKKRHELTVLPEVLEILSRCWDTDPTIAAVVSQLHTLLQQHQQPFEPQFVYNLIDSAVWNRVHGEAIIHSLQEDYPALCFTITERTVRTASERDEFAALKAILKSPPAMVTVTKNALFAAAKTSDELLTLLISRGEDGSLTRGALLSAAGSPADEFLVHLTLQTAARTCSAGDAEALASFEALLLNFGGRMAVNDQLMRAAINNRWRYRSILQVVIDTAGTDFRLTKDFLDEAAEKSMAALKLFFNRFDASPLVDEKTIEAAAAAGSPAHLHFLLHRARQVTITEEIILKILPRCQASTFDGWESNTEAADKLELLYTRGRHIPITEDILIAAAYHNVVELLATWYPNQVRQCLSERVLLATAASQYSIKNLRLYARKFVGRTTDKLNLVSKLGCAVRDNHLWAVQNLLSKGAPPDTPDSDLRTPLRNAVRGERESIVKAILQTGAVNVNSVDLRGESSLFGGARVADTTIVRLLLEAGADPNIVNIRGQTAYSIASDNIRLGIMRILEEFGADTSLASCEGGLELCEPWW